METVGIKIGLQLANAAQVQSAQQAITAGFVKMAGTAEQVSAATAQQVSAMDAARRASQQSTALITSGLDQTHAAAKKLNKEILSTGLTAGQTANALRMLPAQFTDIIVSLQGGQNPLTVMFQQGGQLADMFGGIGHAARAMGSHILGLINPFTAAAAAAAVMGFAYYKGSKEADEYRRAIVMTGNAVGTTVGSMQDMAAAISEVAGTKGAAADALAQMAQGAQVAGASLQKFTQIAVQLESAAGQPVRATVEAFASLADSPADAAAELNKSLNFLTASTYEQIKALEEQGKSTEAAALAQKTYADALADRAREIQANLGHIERGWRAVKGAAKSAWDAMLDVGRPDSLTEKITDAHSQIDRFTAKGMTKSAESYRAAASNLQEQLRLEQRAAEAQSREARRNQAGIKFADLSDKYTSKDDQIKSKIAEVRNIGAAAGKSATEVEALVKQLKESDKYKDKGASKPAGAIGATDTQLASLRAQLEAEKQRAEMLRQYGAEADKLTAGEKKAIEIEQQLALAKDKTVAARLRDQLAIAKQVGAQQKANAATEAAIKLQEDNRKYLQQLEVQRTEHIRAVMNEAGALNEQADRIRVETDNYGQAKSAIAALTASKLEATAASFEATRAAALENGTSEETLSRLDEEIKALRAKAAAYRNLASAERASEEAGVARKAAEETRREWERTADTIEKSLTDALMRGFESSKGFIENLRSTLSNAFNTMVLRPVVQAIIAPVSTALAATASGSAMAGTPGAAGGAPGVLSSANLMYKGIKGGFSAVGAKFGSIGASIQYGTTPFSQQSTMLAAQEVGMGTTAGTMTSIGTAAAGIAAGLLAGKAISGKYSAIGSNSMNAVAGGTAVGAVVGSVVPVIGTAIGAAIGGIVGGFANRAFGTSAKETSAAGLTGTLSASGARVQQFADWKQDGGWFRSDRSGRDTAAAPREVQDFLAEAARKATEATQSYAKALGLNAASVAGYSKAITINLKDLDAAAQEKAIVGALDSFADDMAQSAYGRALDALRRYGETASQTLQRLGTALSGVNQVFDTLNARLLQTSIAGADAATKLVDTFGGMDAFRAATARYFETVYSEQERLDTLSRQAAAAMAELGQAMPPTRAAFRAIVEAQDLTTESGRRTYAQLLGLTDVLGQLWTAADTKAAQDAAAAQQAAQQAAQAADALRTARLRKELELLEALGKTQDALALRRQLELEALDPTLHAIQAQIHAAQDAAEATQRLTDSMAALKRQGQGISEFLRSLEYGDLGTASPEQRMQATRDDYIGTLAKARAGDENALARVTESARAYIDSGRDYYASGPMLQAIIAQITSELRGLPAYQQYSAEFGGAFALGGAFTNGVVSEPTMFSMAGGKAGLMGEAGPEAIMPLKRMPNGSLGVQVQAASTGTAGGQEIIELRRQNEHLAALVRLQSSAAQQTIGELSAMREELRDLRRTSQRLAANA